ncbi:MAG: hypothetical protein DRO13_01850 [Thermoprotei archaeon]|nr:MAG: hypothetical protein DRO13_01850 [Thermoprotei archaeon]
MRGIYEKYLGYLKDSLSYVRSIDGFLVKLSNVVYDLEEYCDKDVCDPVEVVKAILSSKELALHISRLSCHKDLVYSAIANDPRHRVLRKYLDVIRSILDSSECSDANALETHVYPATWAKERMAWKRWHKGTAERGTSLNLDNLVKSLVIISFTLFIIALVLLLT